MVFKMLSISEAELLLDLIKTYAPNTVVRVAFPYTPELMQLLREEGYLPVLEHNVWNDKEIVISTTKCFDPSSRLM